MGYDYEIAKTVLSEPEKNRILCLYLNCDMKAFNGIVRPTFSNQQSRQTLLKEAT